VTCWLRQPRDPRHRPSGWRNGRGHLWRLRIGVEVELPRGVAEARPIASGPVRGGTANVGVVAGHAVKITEAEERELRRRASQYTRPWEIRRGDRRLLRDNDTARARGARGARWSRKPRRSGVVAAAQLTEWATLDRFAEAGIRGGPFGRSLPWPRG
jgi:hypothetical protein